MTHILSGLQSHRVCSVLAIAVLTSGCLGVSPTHRPPVVSASPLDDVHCTTNHQDPVVDEGYRDAMTALNRSLGFRPEQLNGLELYREGTNLVKVGGARLTSDAAEAFKRMQADAAKQDVNFWIVSGFRSLADQERIIRDKRKAGQSSEQIRRVNMPVGHSQHHLGTAVDLGTRGSTNLTNAFANTRAYYWLAQNAWRYGFKAPYVVDGHNGIMRESWHWQYVGVATCYRSDGSPVPTTIESLYGPGQPHPLNSPPFKR